MKNTTKTKAKKQITTVTEKELSIKIGFTGIYVESLIKSAQKANYEGETVRQLLQSVKAKRRAAALAAAKSFNLSLKTYVEMKAKAYRLLNDFSTGHSMGCTRRVELTNLPGETATKTLVRNDDTADYAKSCKWRPTYGAIVLRFTAKELAALENIEGVWTIAKPDGAAKWLKATGAKNTYSVVWENGFVAGASHSTASLEAARRLEIAKAEQKAQTSQNDLRFIGFDHIAKFACRPGVEMFCRRHNLDIENGYQLGFLKSFNDRYAAPFLNRVSTAG